MAVESFGLRDAFASAIEVSGQPLPLVYRGRALLAYARRMARLGSNREADRLRAEAVELFAHQNLVGWQRHAEQLSLHPEAERPATSVMPDELSPTEQRLLRLILQDRRNKQIATEMYVSLRTVEKMLTRIYRHFDVHSKAELLEKIKSAL